MVTTAGLQDGAGVTNDDHNFATDADVIRHWALKLYEAEDEHIRGGTIFALLGPIGVLQRYGLTQADMETVIRAASRRLPFPFDLFQDDKAA
jgi:hypothetical protein